MKSLSAKQKSVLCQVARRAFDYLVAKGQLAGIRFPDWRHESAERAIGIASLKLAGNQHYNRLLAYWEELAGESGRAMDALVREQTDSKRQAEVVLLRELEQASLPLAYAEAISYGKFRRHICDTDARECWQVVYTVKARIRAKARKVETASTLQRFNASTS